MARPKMMTRLKKKARPADMPPAEPDLQVEPHPLDTLYDAVTAVAARPSARSRTAKLLAAGVPKMAQKLVEEAAEVAIDSVRGQHASVVNETADLFYNVVVLLQKLEIPLADVWAEMARRRKLYGISEKLPKPRTESQL